MFTVPTGGCMVVGNTYNEAHKLWPEIYEDTGVYPSAWYHYTQYSKGAYVKLNGKLVGRFMYYYDTDGNAVGFGDIKAINHTYITRIERLCKQLGLTQTRNVTTQSRFKVHGIKHKHLNKGETWHCPLPNCDNQQKDFVVVFDKNTNEFIFDQFTRMKGTAVTSTYVHNGFIDSSKIINI